MFILTNTNISPKNQTKKFEHHQYRFYTDDVERLEQGSSNWFYKGHVFPRHKSGQAYNDNNVVKMLDSLYETHKENFIHYIKGNFIIIRLTKDGFTIYSDHFAIKKFFIYETKGDFIISDDLKVITDNVQVVTSQKSMAIYSLTYHFTGGTTLFENITHNKPAETIHFDGKQTNRMVYWEPKQLLVQESQNVGLREISNALSNAVEQGLLMGEKEKISLSLTGGADTRNLLAVFLNKNIKPHLYTYGNPESADCKKATAIAKGLRLNHSIYDIQMDVDTFERYARKIIRQSGGLASIHRVHRIMAVEKEKEFADWMFLGTLGGEFVKGVSEDAYIVPTIVTDNWQEDTFSIELLANYFQDKGLIEERSILEGVRQFVKEEPYMHGDITERKHSSLSYITAHLHDAQDVNLYNSVMQEVYTPFLDIDYLELLFSSGFTFDKKEVIKNVILRKMQNPEYAAKFLKNTYPPLLHFKYAGEHKPSEVLFNKYYAAAMKVFRKKTTPKYPPNFPLGDWMKAFVERNLPKCKNYDILVRTFDIDKMLLDLKGENNKRNEAYWLKYTNPIMMMYIIDEFKS